MKEIKTTYRFFIDNYIHINFHKAKINEKFFRMKIRIVKSHYINVKKRKDLFAKFNEIHKIKRQKHHGNLGFKERKITTKIIYGIFSKNDIDL